MQDTTTTNDTFEKKRQTQTLTTFPIIETTLAESVVVSTETPPEADQAQPSEDETIPPPKRLFLPNWSHIIACVLFLILVGEHITPLVWTVVDSYFHPKAVVTLFAARKPLTFPYTFLAVTGTADRSHNQIPSRLLSVTTPTKSVTIQTTGVGYTPAVQATGKITFYNEAPYPQTIQAGTVLTGTDGVQVITDESASIVAGNGGTNGSALVSAHVLVGGTVGNIAPLAINGLCCLAGIYAKNTSRFSGGMNPQAYQTVSVNDLQTAARQFAGALDPQARNNVQSQIAETERILTPIQCRYHTAATPKVGERATQALVSVSETCNAQVYDCTSLQDVTRVLFVQDAGKQADSRFILHSSLVVALEKTTLLDRKHATYKLLVNVSGVLLFHFSETELHHLVAQIAGKSLSQAQQQLLTIQGVEGVSIQPARQGEGVLPAVPDQIQIVVS